MTIRSLFVSDILPRRPAGGAVQRMDTVTAALAELGCVDALFLAPPDASPPGAWLPGAASPGAAPPDGTARFARAWVAGLPPYTGARAGLEIAARGPSAAHAAHLRRTLPPALPDEATRTRYDLVWFNRERTWLPLRGAFTGRTVVDVDDFEDVLIRRWRRLGRGVWDVPLTPWQRVQARRSIAWWGRVHRRVAREADAAVVACTADAARMGTERAVVVPNTYPAVAARSVGGVVEAARPPGTAGAQAPPRTPAAPGPAAHSGAPAEAAEPAAGPGDGGAAVILFQGSFDWGPNADAAAWLVGQVLPLVRARVPEVTVVLAGRSAPDVAALAGPHVQVTGEVPSMAPYLRTADLVVVPLRVGSGTRIKILEAFAYSVPVVSTTIGAEGLDVVAGRHLAVADTAAGLARHCADLLTDRTRRQAMAAAAGRLHAAGHLPEHAAGLVRQAALRAAAAGPPAGGRIPVVRSGSSSR